MLTAIQWARCLEGRRESAVMCGDCYYVSMAQALNNAANLADQRIAGGIRINRNSAILEQRIHKSDVQQAYSCFSLMVNSTWFYIHLKKMINLKFKNTDRHFLSAIKPFDYCSQCLLKPMQHDQFIPLPNVQGLNDSGMSSVHQIIINQIRIKTRTQYQP